MRLRSVPPSVVALVRGVVMSAVRWLVMFLNSAQSVGEVVAGGELSAEVAECCGDVGRLVMAEPASVVGGLEPRLRSVGGLGRGGRR
jgi:hypothetical protein